MASEYGSCPVEHPAHQTRSFRSTALARRRAGSTPSLSRAKAEALRKKLVSQVTIASQTESARPTSGVRLSRSSRGPTPPRPRPGAIAPRRLSTRYSFPSPSSWPSRSRRNPWR
jgi:hypothetical protein